MCVCDDRLRFTFVAPNAPGCSHDARIYALSRLPGLARLASEIGAGYHLLGDGAYPNTQYCVAPYKTPTTREQRNFSFCRSSTRIAIECAFGRAHSTKLNPELLSEYVCACVILHNVTIDHDGAGRQYTLSVVLLTPTHTPSVLPWTRRSDTASTWPTSSQPGLYFLT